MSKFWSSISAQKKLRLPALAFVFLVIGLIIRLYLIGKKDVFIDEAIYLQIAHYNNLWQIFGINHWVKDHGILYYLFLKPFVFLTHNIVILRLTNLSSFLVIGFLGYRFFHKFGTSFVPVLFVSLFSISHYFVYLNSSVSPFNLAFFFAAVSLFILLDLIQNNFPQKHLSLRIFFFVLATIFGFYSDYSFFYMFFFFLSVLVWVYFEKRKYFELLMSAYLIVLVFIIPGVFQFIGNREQVIKLFSDYSYHETNFFYFLFGISRALFRLSPLFSFSLLAFILGYPFALKTPSIVKVISLSIILNIVLMYFVINNFVSVYMERSFWVFYFFVLMLITFLIQELAKLRERVGLLIIFFLLIVVILAKYFSSAVVSQGDVSTEIPYKQLLERLIKTQDWPDKLVLVDSEYNYFPLTNYFFSELYPASSFLYKEIDAYLNNVSLNIYPSCSQFNPSFNINDRYDFVIFKKTDCNINQYKNKNNRLFRLIRKENRSSFVRVY